LNDQTLLVNLSNKFEQVGESISRQQDRLLAYALVNTLLCGKRANRVSFFVGGKTPAGFTGEIDWAGPFYANRGLAHTP